MYKILIFFIYTKSTGKFTQFINFIIFIYLDCKTFTTVITHLATMNRTSFSSLTSAEEFELIEANLRGESAETPPPNAAALLGSPLPPRYRNKLLGIADYGDDGER